MRLLPLVLPVVWLVALVLSACEEEKHYYVSNVGNGELTPTMLTLDVKTFISDSGYTKYYITSPLWAIHEAAREPFWKFPKGIELEQYDDSMQVVAKMRCDSAKYLSRQRLWRLDGHVMMVNTKRDTFLTKQLYWDQTKRELYSDSFIHIVRQESVIEGKGFTSNESMTRYRVKNPQGIFPVKKDHTAVSKDPKPMPVDDSETYDETQRFNVAPPRASSRSHSGFMRLPDSLRSAPH